MAAVRCGSLECFPENILIDILSYLNVRELVRNSRVCRRWKQLVKDQRLWRSVDLSSWKAVPSRVLWILLRQYLGRGLRYLRLRGLLLSARGGAFLTESWLQGLTSKCPRLRRLCLLHTDLRGLHSCSLLPPTLQVLELHYCEVPPAFFTQNPSGSETDRTATENEAPSSAGQSMAIQTLVLDTVPSFSDQHLQSLSSWPHLSHLELRDLIRVTVAGLKGCVPPGVQSLTHLKHLELETSKRTQMVALGLGGGWPGLEGLSLGGKEVGPGLLSVGRLPDLRSLRLHTCRLAQVMVLRSCRCLTQLRRLEFSEVEFIEEEVREDETDGLKSEDDPVMKFRHVLCELLPRCTVCFNKCTLTINND
ncbi:F-box/LRR-repeat protein 12-like [Triplophysa rosa]|uniref:F-box/LRR-repeat protein 12-like n=1 Tax=Triplophysa rosa TaxID=992332 RepID=A0A9W7WRQ4_TRIRA|nr:F-box/LRR-repeat protein 12-like [Triplophysa rosa]KAI7807094.1 putative F-box/LRR-repeat protein 12-like [Triplophysa rosa]